MMYLIEHLSLWLFLTAAFAALAGWAFAAQRDAPREVSLRRQRDGLVQDLGRLAAGEGGEPAPLEVDARQSMADLSNSRITQLERDLDQARSRASEATTRIAELERRLEQQAGETIQPLVSTPIDVAPAPPAPPVLPEPSSPTADESEVLQSWRLRYFEQRVRYLEQRAASVEPAPEVPAVQPLMASAAPPLEEWRLREATARADYLEGQLRTHEAAAAPAEPEEASASPFASNAEVDTLLRWRMLYLERRLAHTQAQPRAAEPVAAVATPVAEAGPDLDRWKWRARYLESRVRHLSARLDERPTAAPAAPIQAVMAQNGDAEHAPPPPLAPAGQRPEGLPGPRNGAPDDFTLIDGVSALQQSTLNAIGIFHFDQIAAWTPANVAWVDQYLRLRGRIVEDEWVEQAEELVEEGAAHTNNGEARPY